MPGDNEGGFLYWPLSQPNAFPFLSYLKREDPPVRQMLLHHEEVPTDPVNPRNIFLQHSRQKDVPCSVKPPRKHDGHHYARPPP